MHQEAKVSLWRFGTWPRAWQIIGVVAAILAVPLCMAVPLLWVDNPAIAVPFGLAGCVIGSALVVVGGMHDVKRRESGRDAMFRKQGELLGMVFASGGPGRATLARLQQQGSRLLDGVEEGVFSRTIRGVRAGIQVSVHDVESGDSESIRTSSFALARAGRADLADFSIEPKRLHHRITGGLFRKTVRTGHSAFDARYRVLSGDPDRHEEVVAVLAPLVGWLLEQRHSYRFELCRGNVIVLTRGKIPGDRIPELVALAEGFMRRLPSPSS